MPGSVFCFYNLHFLISYPHLNHPAWIPTEGNRGDITLLFPWLISAPVCLSHLPPPLLMVVLTTIQMKSPHICPQNALSCCTPRPPSLLPGYNHWSVLQSVSMCSNTQSCVVYGVLYSSPVTTWSQPRSLSQQITLGVPGFSHAWLSCMSAEPSQCLQMGRSVAGN